MLFPFFPFRLKGKTHGIGPLHSLIQIRKETKLFFQTGWKESADCFQNSFCFFHLSIRNQHFLMHLFQVIQAFCNIERSILGKFQLNRRYLYFRLEGEQMHRLNLKPDVSILDSIEPSSLTPAAFSGCLICEAIVQIQTVRFISQIHLVRNITVDIAVTVLIILQFPRIALLQLFPECFTAHLLLRRFMV